MIHFLTQFFREGTLAIEIDIEVGKQFAILTEQKFRDAGELLNKMIKAITHSVSLYLGYCQAIGKML